MREKRNANSKLRPVVGYAVMDVRCNIIDWTGYTKPLLIFKNRVGAELWLEKHSPKNREIRKVKFTPTTERLTK